LKREYVPLFDSINTSTKLADLPDHKTRLFYVLLLPQCDAWGRIAAEPRQLMAKVWPLLGEDAASTQRCLEALISAGLVRLYANADLRWIQVPDWDDKAGRIGQVRRDRGASRFPAPEPSFLIAECNPRVTLGSPQGKPAERRGEEKRGEEKTVLSTEPAADEPRPAPKPRKEPTGDHADLIRFWDSEWQRTRKTPWAWNTVEASHMARARKLAAGDVGIVRTRITRLLESDNPWMHDNASPAILVSRWNQLGVNGSSNGHTKVSPGTAAVMAVLSRQGGAL